MYHSVVPTHVVFICERKKQHWCAPFLNSYKSRFSVSLGDNHFTSMNISVESNRSVSATAHFEYISFITDNSYVKL